MTKDKKDTYTAALLIIGNEILSGRTQDTNSNWMAAQFSGIGIQLVEIRVVPDDETEIIEAIKALRSKVDYLMTTGGIGPTHDDITAGSVAKAFGVELELNDDALQMMIKHYGDEVEMTPARQKMAMIPAGAGLIYNPVSGAPGFYLENVYVMAGVPRIMQAMFDAVKNELAHGQPLMSRTVTCNLQESQIAEGLSAVQDKYAEISIGSYPHYRGGALGLSLVLRGTDEGLLDQATQNVVDLIESLGGQTKAVSVMAGEQH